MLASIFLRAGELTAEEESRGIKPPGHRGSSRCRVIVYPHAGGHLSQLANCDERWWTSY